MAGLTLGVANEALAAVYQSGTIPHLVQLGQSLSATDLAALADFFNASGGQLTRLHVTAAPTLAGTIDGSKVVAMRFPIQLDWTETISTNAGQFEKLVTTATGALTLTMILVANVAVQPDLSNSTMTIGAQLDTEPATTAESPMLTLDATSPVQLQDPADNGAGPATFIQNTLAKQLGNSLTLTVSPVFNLPTGALALTRSDVRSKAGMLLAGVQILGGALGQTDPTQLSNLLPGDGSNVFLQITSSAVNAVMQNAVQTGALTALAKQQHSNAEVDSASATFQNNQFVAQVHVKLVNECPLNTDLHITLTRTVSIVLKGGSVEIDERDDHSLDLGDNIVCLIATLGVAAVVILLGILCGAFFFWLASVLVVVAGVYVTVQLLNGLAGSKSSTILNLTQPIPDSDFLPTLSGGFYQISNGAMLIAATAATAPDTINAIIYVRVLVSAGGIEVGATKPLAGANMELMAQDVPPPPGASQVPPGSSSGLGNHRVTVSYTYIPPTSDQQLAVGQTDFNGEVRFGLLASQLVTQAGEIKEERTFFDPDADRFITIPTLTPVMVAKPDLYFRVAMPDGSVADTRQLPGGLLVSSVSSQVGTLANPLTFSFGGVLVIGNQGATIV